MTHTPNNKPEGQFINSIGEQGFLCSIKIVDPDGKEESKVIDDVFIAIAKKDNQMVFMYKEGEIDRRDATSSVELIIDEGDGVYTVKTKNHIYVITTIGPVSTTDNSLENSMDEQREDFGNTLA